MQKSERIFKLIILLISLIGIILHLESGFKTFGYNIFWFFTVLSNIAVLLHYICFFFIPVKISYRVKGYLLEPIMLTGIINWFILVPFALKEYGSILPLLQPSNFFVHGLIPVLVIIDWFVFDPKGIFDKKDYLRWMIIPLLYSIIIYVRALFGKAIFQGSRYPYPFFDPKHMNGVIGVIVVLVLISICYVFIGKLLYKIKESKRI